MRKRSEDREEVIQRRLVTASQEIENYDRYDYILVNDRLEDSIEMLRKLCGANAECARSDALERRSESGCAGRLLPVVKVRERLKPILDVVQGSRGDWAALISAGTFVYQNPLVIKINLNEPRNLAFRGKIGMLFLAPAGEERGTALSAMNILYPVGRERSMKLIEGFDSNYRYILVAARRARQLQSGAPPVVQTNSRKPCRIAQDEIKRGQSEVGDPGNSQRRRAGCGDAGSGFRARRLSTGRVAAVGRCVVCQPCA